MSVPICSIEVWRGVFRINIRFRGEEELNYVDYGLHQAFLCPVQRDLPCARLVVALGYREVMRLKWLWWLLGIPIALALVVGGGLLLVRRNHNAARAEWKNQASQELSALSSSNHVNRNELETHKRPSGPNEPPNWISDNVITTTNGEFLVFKFRHGHNEGFVHHLFLARGSNEMRFSTTSRSARNNRLAAGHRRRRWKRKTGPITNRE